MQDYTLSMCGRASNQADPLRSLLQHSSKPIEWLELLLSNRHKFGVPIDVDATLHAILRTGSPRDEAVTALLRHGADVRKATSDTGERPIFLAYRHGCSEFVIKALLDAAAAAATAAGDARPAAPLVIDPCTPSSLLMYLSHPCRGGL
jgi:hypothetical protein